MTPARAVGIGGLALTLVYATAICWISFVADPAAAVPDRTLAQILDGVADQGYDLGQDIVVVTVLAAFGVLLSATGTLLVFLRRWGVWASAAWQLGVLVLGAPAAFWSGFGLGMDVADAFGVSGGAHTLWSGGLYFVSLLAVLGLVGLLCARTVMRSPA